MAREISGKVVGHHRRQPRHRPRDRGGVRAKGAQTVIVSSSDANLAAAAKTIARPGRRRSPSPAICASSRCQQVFAG